MHNTKTSTKETHVKTIELFKTPKGWMADFINDAEMQELFGTTIIPTAYTAQADVAHVMREIQALNPHCAVALR